LVKRREVERLKKNDSALKEKDLKGVIDRKQTKKEEDEKNRYFAPRKNEEK